ncbi:MAG: valine--tRNA ligase [Wolbachia endosymbiont of Menacanthus eurysternus]|nr:MAG: valine--tRNA ligase [Wolbachia endosymbiont of Menacanthus eurysternus]
MLEGKYSFHEIENRHNALWEDNNIYRWSGGSNTFVIDTPPPTISGELHIGHVFSYCHTDFIARFQRMIGRDVFYPIGFDGNGLPTERLVEQVYKIRAKEVKREEFIEMCYGVIKKLKQKFKNLFRSIGISYDWNLEYHTLSRDAITLSQMSFIDLYNRGYAYRKMQPIFWDPVDKTAISYAEIDNKICESLLNTIIFSTQENEQIKITTTRPELLPACVAVFCHPEDIRYTHLIGKMAIVSVTEEKVPIMADNRVKINKGTGLVMCCTFGDELDVYWQQKYNLPMKIIINSDGKISLNSIYHSKYRCRGVEIICSALEGLRIKEARKKMIEILSKSGSLVKSTNVFHSVKCAERSGAQLEIFSTYQWFIKTLNEKAKVLDRVKKCNWYPDFMRKRMEVWIRGLSWDWCISRQRYFGVPFPIWYSRRKGEEGKIILAEVKNLPVDPFKDLPTGYSRKEVIPDQDVMDTWATSAITPQLNALAINNKFYLRDHRYDKIFPADLRTQSHEIIRTWAFYTILKAHYHANSLPWKNIMISGWCLADNKKKMSKSKGNIITPNVVLNIYGADVVRYWAANSKLGIDTVYSENTLKTGKRFIIKLWNASKFVSMFIKKYQIVKINSISETIDKWILSKLYKVIDRATNDLLQFEYYKALRVVEDFFWKDFCDNYLELVKKRVYGDRVGGDKASSAKQGLICALNVILRLFAPFFPYITEEIYYQLYSCNSIHRKNNWPIKEELIYDECSKEMGDNSVQILNLVRKIKADNNVSLKHLIKKLTIKVNVQENRLNLSTQNDLQTVCNAKLIQWSEDVTGFVASNEKFTVGAEL